MCFIKNPLIEAAHHPAPSCIEHIQILISTVLPGPIKRKKKLRGHLPLTLDITTL